MNTNWEVLYQHDPNSPQNVGLVTIRPVGTKLHKPGHTSRHIPTRQAGSWLRNLGVALAAVSLGGLIGPMTPAIRMESAYYLSQVKAKLAFSHQPSAISEKPLPQAVPVVFDPLVTPDGASINPVNTDFSVVIPKIGINAAVTANVDPANPEEYLDVLKTGVAHAQSSFLPNEDGTTYIFSHSTSFDWFVRDLNAVFYLLKNLEEGDKIVLFYQGKRYTYSLTDKRVVSPKDVSYLVPETGTKRLILQTCWPPGSTTERLLIFADLVEDQGQSI